MKPVNHATISGTIYSPIRQSYNQERSRTQIDFWLQHANEYKDKTGKDVVNNQLMLCKLMASEDKMMDFNKLPVNTKVILFGKLKNTNTPVDEPKVINAYVEADDFELLK